MQSNKLSHKSFNLRIRCQTGERGGGSKLNELFKNYLNLNNFRLKKAKLYEVY